MKLNQIDLVGVILWLASDDTGTSSMFLARVTAGGPHHRFAYPYEPADFGRCYRFLRAVPGARKNLDKMKEHGPVWSAYVDAWPEMERLWEEESPSGRAPKLYAMMEAIQIKAEKYPTPTPPDREEGEK